MRDVDYRVPTTVRRRKTGTCTGALVVLSAALAAGAQAPGCTVVAGVISSQYGHYGTVLWEPRHGVSLESFVARDGRQRLPVWSVREDMGPRRIALVLVFDRGWATAEHGAFSEALRSAAEAIFDRARPEDSLALLTAVGPRIAVPFGSAPGVLRAAVTRLSPSPTPLGRADSVLNALLEAADWFGAPEPGDAILLIGGFPRASRGRVAQARRVLVGRGIRLFLFGGGITAGCDFLDCYSVSPDLGLAWGTGGTHEEVGFDGAGNPDENLRLWQDEAEALYDMAASEYILRLPRTGPHVRIELSRDGAHTPGHVIYAMPLPVCP